ncbi:hypothetical protein QU593_10275 [Rossellomorea marisflavi]|uniref:hypothetical protein n=1 Tax=Rossellomorea marisflavi TaxID=189381 RepID=UPI0025AF3219|nr:hypothetical protein [Rossellomorea marisflavi]WJV20791.1 hypothetical protein QU593_10275 [Rossellomorea marisflavi]
MKAIIEGITYEGTPKEILEYERLKTIKLRKPFKPVVTGNESVIPNARHFETEQELCSYIDQIIKNNHSELSEEE